jgi:hypothetical protein
LMNDQIKLCRPHSKDQEALTKYWIEQQHRL